MCKVTFFFLAKLDINRKMASVSVSPMIHKLNHERFFHDKEFFLRNHYHQKTFLNEFEEKHSKMQNLHRLKYSKYFHSQVALI